MKRFLSVFFFLSLCGHIYPLRCTAFSNVVSPDRLAEKDISYYRLNMQCSTFTSGKKITFKGPIYRIDRLPIQQSGTLVSGKITDTEGQQVSYCKLTLSNSENGAIIATTRSDSTGSYRFTGLKTGHYLMNVVHMGYQQSKPSRFSIQQEATIVLPTILLLPLVNQLEQVSILSKKPLFEKRADKTIVNVGTSALATGGSVIDVLEISPGVALDNNQLTLMGKQGVTVMIDDKVVKLSANQLISLLQGMPSNSIDKIELITSPSAKYDSEGKGGIINIKTKKGTNLGFNGTVTSSVVVAKHLRPGGGMLFNYKFNKLNIFGNYSFQHTRQTTQYLSDKVISGRVPVLKYFQDETTNKQANAHNLSLGADLNLGAHHTLGVIVNRNIKRDNGGFIQDVYFGQNKPERSDSSLRSSNRGEFSFLTHGFAINSKHIFSPDKRVLLFDASYTAYRSTNSEQFVNEFFTAGRLTSKLPEYIANHAREKINLFVLKTDYTHATEHFGTFEFGLKSAFTRSEGSIVFQSKSSGVFLTDPSRSNTFDYNETIGAAYMNYNTKIGKIVELQAGIRAEYTHYTGFSPTNGQSVSGRYLQLFPNLSIFHSLDKNTIGLAYSRRIGRPSYEDLNPFLDYSSPYFYTQGNPLLIPETTNSVELSYGYNSKLSVGAGFSRTSDYYNYFTSLAGENGATKQTVDNFDKYDSWYLSINYNTDLADFWSLSTNGDLSYDHYQTPYLNELLDVKRASYSFQALNSFKLDKTLALELIGLYRSKQVVLARIIDSRYRVDAALKYSMLKAKVVVKTGVTDIFYSYINKGTNTFANLYGTYYNRNENRRFNLSVSYKFGGNLAATIRKHGNTEELERIK